MEPAVVASVSAAAATVFAAVSVALTVATVAWRSSRATRRDELQQLLRMGLVREGDGLRGVIEGLRVDLADEGGVRAIRVHLPGLDPTFRLAPRDLESLESVTGDPVFDARFSARVPDPVRGLLDAGLRSALPSPTRVVGGWLSVESGWTAVDLRRALTLARSFLRDPAERLQAVAAADPVPEVRRRALLALAATDRAGAAPLLAAAAAGAPPDRFVALLATGATGVGAALAGCDEPVRHALLSHLVERGSPEQVADAITALARPGLPRPLWFRLTEAAAAHPGHAVRRALAEALPRVAAGLDPFVVQRAALALAADLDREVEPALASWLPVLEGDALAAAVHWLQRRGTIASVPALDAVQGGPELATQVRRAKASIQGRAGGERGGVALAEPAGGGVALASPPGGALAEPTLRS